MEVTPILFEEQHSDHLSPLHDILPAKFEGESNQDVLPITPRPALRIPKLLCENGDILGGTLNEIARCLLFCDAFKNEVDIPPILYFSLFLC